MTTTLPHSLRSLAPAASTRCARALATERPAHLEVMHQLLPRLPGHRQARTADAAAVQATGVPDCQPATDPDHTS